MPFLLFASISFFGKKEVELFPDDGQNYHSISSDRPQTSLGIAKVNRSTEEFSGERRNIVMLGENFPLFSQPFEGFSVDYQLAGGVYHQFDLSQSLDGLGYDGSIFSTTTLVFNHFSVDLSVFHLSGHLGDEYVAETKRARLEYSRNEALLALRWQNSNFLTHSEVGWDYSDNKAAPDDPWRLRQELQYKFWNHGTSSLFTAVDFESKQERNWRINSTLQLGLSMAKEQRERFRAYFEFYDGGSKLSEFYSDNERMISFGLVLYR